jgi:GDP-4-dehydro-6-deoxy-D-mannose reductase
MLALATSGQEGVTVLVTRSFTHIGPGQAPSFAAASFAEQIARIEVGQSKPVLRVGNLNARRDLTDVRDTVRAYQLLMASGTHSLPYNVCSGEAHRVSSVLEGLLAAASIEVSVCEDPARARRADNPLLLGDRTRITRDVGWRPEIPLARTLGDLLNYWREVVTSKMPL